ncbi:MAG: alpha-amylase, partial [Eudoraea sp.]|nr:alpha-amylase [Eudoraea sp.]
HGLIRTDFPGGWAGDAINAFTGKGLGAKARRMQEFLKTLLLFRKSEAAIHEGATKHFAPENGIYVLVRYKGNKKVFLILNKNEQSVSLPMHRFRETDILGATFKDVITGKEMVIGDELILKNKGVLLLSN